MTHTITHIEIPAPDLAKAMAFYAKIFLWEVQIITPDKYAFFRILETSGGGFDSSLKPATEGTGPQLTIDVEDIDQTLRQIQTEGGSIILPKTEIGEGHGFFAVFLDPNGNSMQLHSRR